MPNPKYSGPKNEIVKHKLLLLSHSNSIANMLKYYQNIKNGMPNKGRLMSTPYTFDGTGSPVIIFRIASSAVCPLFFIVDI